MHQWLPSAFGDGLRWNWAFDWTRPLRSHDISELQLLRSLLEPVCLSIKGKDELIWTAHKNGIFSVKSFHNELANHNINGPQKMIAGLWKILVPYRVEIFVWLAMLGTLNTKDKLIRLGILEASNGPCLLCNSEPESGEHLFLHCSVASSMWMWWLNMWNIQWCFASSISDALQLWVYPKSNTFLKKVWVASFHIILWTIWRERNNRCFENISCSLQQLQDLVLLRLGWWIKGWGVLFPYKSNEIIRNPLCLDWIPPSSQPVSLVPKQSDWVPPPHNALTWNVDASLKVSDSKSAIGGVLRNHLGEFLCISQARFRSWK